MVVDLSCELHSTQRSSLHFSVASSSMSTHFSRRSSDVPRMLFPTQPDDDAGFPVPSITKFTSTQEPPAAFRGAPANGVRLSDILSSHAVRMNLTDRTNQPPLPSGEIPELPVHSASAVSKPQKPELHWSRRRSCRGQSDSTTARESRAHITADNSDEDVNIACWVLKSAPWFLPRIADKAVPRGSDLKPPLIICHTSLREETTRRRAIDAWWLGPQPHATRPLVGQPIPEAARSVRHESPSRFSAERAGKSREVVNRVVASEASSFRKRLLASLAVAAATRSQRGDNILNDSLLNGSANTAAAGSGRASWPPVNHSLISNELTELFAIAEEELASSRLRALKSNDAEAYLAHVSHLKVTSLLNIMETTHRFMLTLGAQLDQKQRQLHPRTAATAAGGSSTAAATGIDAPMDGVLPCGSELAHAQGGRQDEDDELRRFRAYVASTKDEYKLLHRHTAEIREQPAALFAVTLMPHQMDGLRFLASLRANSINGILADEMGVGKTLQTLAFFLHMKGEGDGSTPELEPPRTPNLVLAPLSIIQEWREAAVRFCPTLSIGIFDDDVDEDGERTANDGRGLVHGRLGAVTRRGTEKPSVTGSTEGDGDDASSTSGDSSSSSDSPSSSSVSSEDGRSRRGRRSSAGGGRGISWMDKKRAELAQVQSWVARARTRYVSLLALNRVPRYAAALANIKWNYLVVDEAHKAVSNPKTITAQAIARIPCDRRLVLTGTPLNNDIQELWSLLSFLNPDVFTGQRQSFDDVFRKPFASMAGRTAIQASDVALTEEERALLVMRMHQILRPFMLRRTKRDVDASLRITFHQLLCPLSALQTRLLTQVRTAGKLPSATADLEAPALGSGGGGGDAAAGRALASSTTPASPSALRLSLRSVTAKHAACQGIVNHPFMVPFFTQCLPMWGHAPANQTPDVGSPSDNNTSSSANGVKTTEASQSASMRRDARLASILVSSSGKFAVLDVMLRCLALCHKKVVLFSHFLDTIDLVQEYLAAAGWADAFVTLTGDDDVACRRNSVEQFRDPNGKVFIMIISVKAGGCGLNLQVASTVILIDRDYTITNEDQAIARVFRIGQTRVVRAIYLTSADPCESRVMEIAERKNKPRLAIVDSGAFQVKRQDDGTDGDAATDVAAEDASPVPLPTTAVETVDMAALLLAADTGPLRRKLCDLLTDESNQRCNVCQSDAVALGLPSSFWAVDADVDARIAAVLHEADTFEQREAAASAMRKRQRADQQFDLRQFMSEPDERFWRQFRRRERLPIPAKRMIRGQPASPGPLKAIGDKENTAVAGADAPRPPLREETGESSIVLREVGEINRVHLDGKSNGEDEADEHSDESSIDEDAALEEYYAQERRAARERLDNVSFDARRGIVRLYDMGRKCQASLGLKLQKGGCGRKPREGARSRVVHASTTDDAPFASSGVILE